MFLGWRNRYCENYYTTRGINIVKITMLLNETYIFNVIPIRLPKAFFTELEKKKSHNSYGKIKDLR